MCSPKSTQRYIRSCTNPAGRQLHETVVIRVSKFQGNPGGRTVPLKCLDNPQCFYLFSGKTHMWAHDNDSDKRSVRSWLGQVVSVMMALIKLAIGLVARQQERVLSPGYCMKSRQGCRSKCFSYRDRRTHGRSSLSE